jgi:L-ascorbate metabolism protein UlaG (beta-lactamase superfamily)
MVALILLLLLGGLADLLGWFRRKRPWAGASGWAAVPTDQQPDNTVPSLLAAQDLRVDWLGHSGFLVRWGGHVVLLDPNTSAHCCFLAPRLMEPPDDVARLGCIDAVCLSHAHFDHLDLPTLCRLGDARSLVIPFGCDGYVSGVQGGVTRYVVQAGGRVALAGLEIIAVPAAHNGNRGHPFRSRQPALGYMLKRNGFTLYFAGDTAFRNPFAQIGAEHRPDVAILPIGAFEPARVLGHFHMNPEEAVSAAAQLGVKGVIPCHFGTFRLSFDEPQAALPRFAAAAEVAGLPWMMPRLWRAEE